jgi:hypothetical protein
VTAVPGSPLGGHAACCQLPGNRCRDGNCEVRFPARQGWILLSGTRYQQEHEFTEKLADVMAAGNPIGNAYRLRFVALLLHNRVRRPSLVRKELDAARNRVRFRGNTSRIGLVRCGSELSVKTWDPLAS